MGSHAEAPRPIRVLIVDDSAVVRRLLTEALQQEAGIEVVGSAPDPFVARDQILALAPDVLTLDIEMPRMDGLSFLRRLMHYQPMPVIILSSLGRSGREATLEALRLGAVDVLSKPSGSYSLGDLSANLASKIRRAASVRLGVAPGVATGAAPRPSLRHLVAIGSSTGGTQAIEKVLEAFPADCPPIVIAQHIPAGFSRSFAERLNQCLAMEVKQAEDGDPVSRGRVLIAPGNFHMRLVKGAEGYRVTVQDGPLVCYQRPSVDVLFDSVAQHAGADAVAVILTGMGSDGAQGMKRIREKGGWTIAQDQASCVVYGMPGEAVKAEAVEESRSLSQIPAAIEEALLRAPLLKSS
ncbi:protein-glutamate methylesterase/protein-glutamine glutaminase [Bryobacter aggregatus]|uniref:protein-glutamate methylesterase/protein-glutamine glutaminase n=1 Tax=Bryobacter aggregatus TaxID=360054 RepID=UPI0004E1F498|nr:chemotaxis response regulator protein-glutamate methylesterase [Bryobacter aggregatus]